MVVAKLVASALLIVMLGGCLGQPASETAVSETPTPSPAEAANETVAPAPNTPPTATLNASALNGSIPFNVTFSLNGTDVDGDNLTWTLGIGDNLTAFNGTELPSSVNFTFETEGNFTVRLNVTDGVNATLANLTIAAFAPVAIATVGLPVPDGSVRGSTYAYQSVAGAGVGVSNVVSTATGAAGDPVPKYPAGTDVLISARSVSADIDIETGTPATFTLYRPDGTIAMGPFPATGSADGSAIQYSAGTKTLPSARGEYLLVFTLTVDGVDYFVQDNSTSTGGLRTIEVI